jgi:hypothetical protein
MVSDGERPVMRVTEISGQGRSAIDVSITDTKSGLRPTPAQERYPLPKFGEGPGGGALA